MREGELTAVAARFGIVAALAGLLLVAGAAFAGGSGYNLSYTAPANSSVMASVDLVAVSTSYSSGPNLTASLTLAGAPMTGSSAYDYFWLFGGGATGNSTAWAFERNNSAYLHSPSLPFGAPEQINFTLTGSTLSISVATSLVGPSSGFTFNGEANTGSSSNPATYSFLGSDYSGSAGCVASSCSGNGSGSGTSASGIPPGEIIWPVVLVVVILVVVLTIRRRKRAANVGAAPPSGGHPAIPPPPAPPPGP